MTAPRHRFLIPALAGLLIIAAACTTSGGLGQVPTVAPTPTASVASGPSDETPSIPPSPSASPSGPSVSPSIPPTASPAGSPSPTTSGETMIVRAYYVLDGAPGVEGVAPTLRVVPKTAGLARAALNALLDSEQILDQYSQLSTAIPVGSKLLGISIKNGVATVDLSSEFESGGGSASAKYRLAQVVYTLTQFPTVKQVAFELDGEPVTVFSGEGIVLDEPSDREDYEAFLPSVFVERPSWGATLGNPVRVSGIANVFEAVFFVEVRDAAGDTLAKERVMASCGTGCWGTFDVTIPYDVSSRQEGSVVTYNLSAMDGSIEDERSYPVTLVP
jgi:germination protein M